MKDNELEKFVNKESAFIQTHVETAFLYVIENLLKSICERRPDDVPKGIIKRVKRLISPVLSRNILLQALETSFIEIIDKIRKDEDKFIKYFKENKNAK